MLIFLVIVIDELHCHFGVCGRIELIALAKKLILQFLIILNDTIVNTDHIPSSEVCGWAFVSEGSPWVAQRV